MLYALITGASKGIGKAIAEELAKRNIGLLLVARSENLLKEVASGLTGKYGVNTDYLAIDLSQTGSCQKIVQWCEDKKYAVHILINNAGYGLSGSFEKYPSTEHLDVMKINMNVPVELTSLLLPVLHRQPKAYIVNIASSAAYQAVPGLSVYAAAKAFILRFSRGLRYELRNTNISVTTVCPGATDTDFPNRAGVGIKAQKAAAKLNMSAGKVASLAIQAMYAEKAEVITGFINKAAVFLVWLLPKSIAEKAGAGLYDV